MNKFPAVGWIRANKVASLELLTEINDLRKQNSQLQAAVAELSSEPKIEHLAGLEDKIELRGTYWDNYFRRYHGWSAAFTWREVFGYISPYLVRIPNDEYVKTILTSAAFPRSGKSDTENPKLDDQLFRTIAVQLQALGLVKIQYSESTTGGMNLFWSLTPSGERLMVELRTVKKVSALKPGEDGGAK
jgi:hypothetical protein